MKVFSGRSVAVIVAMLLAGLVLGACGSDDEDSGEETTAAQTAEQNGAGAGQEGNGEKGENGAAGEGGEQNGEAAEEARRQRQEFRQAQRERASENAPTPEERDAQDQAQQFYEILGSEQGDADTTEFDSAGFCDLMSEDARAQTIEYARRSSGLDQEWDCESAMELLVLRAKRTGGFRQVRNAEVVGVNAEGDQATATVRFGRGPLTSIPLVREDGEWKLGQAPGAGG